jgi:hypothetical protein
VFPIVDEMQSVLIGDMISFLFLFFACLSLYMIGLCLSSAFVTGQKTFSLIIRDTNISKAMAQRKIKAVTLLSLLVSAPT